MKPVRSIQGHLTALLLSAVLAVAAAAGGFLYFFAAARLTGAFDRALFAKVAQVSGMTSSDGKGHLEFNASEAELAEFGPARDGRAVAYFEVWRGDGTAFSRSPSLAGRDLPPAPSAVASPRTWDVRLPDGRPGRAVAMRFVPRRDEDDEPAGKAGVAVAVGTAGTAGTTRAAPAPEPTLLVVVAQGRHDLDATLRVLGSSLLLAAAALAVGTCLAVMLAVRRGLRPLHDLAREADAIGANSLHHPFSTGGLPRELRPIVYRLNGLLTRLARAFARERRFTGDAAHELRTPIAELRSLAEVALKWPEATPPEQNYRDALRIATHMESLVTALLAIARCGAGAQPVRVRAVDVGDVLREAWGPLRGAAESRGLSVHWNLGEGLTARSDRGLLLPLVGNLLSNAVNYAPPGGAIDCRLVGRGETVELAIANPCEGLRREDLKHVFEPFWRKDPARTAGHCGLGLALVAAYAEALGADVRAGLGEADRRDVFKVTVNLPAHGWVESEEESNAVAVGGAAG